MANGQGSLEQLRVSTPSATPFHQLFGSFLLCVLFMLEQEDGEGNQGGRVGVRVEGERD